MTEKQEKAREFVNASFDEAYQALRDVVELLPHAGLPKSPKLNSEVRQARSALEAARRTFAALTTEEEKS